MTELQTPINIVTNPVTGSRIDPVCGMSVKPGRKNLVAFYDGRSYWLCAEACLNAFESNPKKYLERKPPKREGFFGSYLERLARANEREFGTAGPRCH